MRLDIEIEKGKYRITQSAEGRVTLYRNGEYWRVGSKFILALAQEIQSLRKAVDAAKGYMTGGASEPPGHTDLMVSPETLDEYIEQSPLPASEPEREPDGWAVRWTTIDGERRWVAEAMRHHAEICAARRRIEGSTDVEIVPVYLGAPAPAEAAEAWLPTAENINALPEPIRRYIHDLSTRCDPAGEVRELTIARDTIRSLEAAPTEAAGKRREWVTQAMVRYAAGHATLGEAIADVLNAVGLPAEATERSEL